MLLVPLLDPAGVGGCHCFPHPERLIANQEYFTLYGVKFTPPGNFAWLWFGLQLRLRVSLYRCIAVSLFSIVALHERPHVTRMGQLQSDYKDKTRF